MKKSFVICSIFFLCLFLTACEKGDVGKEKDKDTEESSSLKQFIKEIDIPKNFKIDIDISEIKSIDKAKIYTVSTMEFDDETVINELLQGEIIETHTYAEGLQYETKGDVFKEYLTIYDGGKSFGIESGVEGGIGYAMETDADSFYNKLSTIIYASPEPPDNIGQIHGYNLKEDYESFRNLSFISYDDALLKTEEMLTKIGFPSFILTETYSLDLETMLDHYELYLDSRSYYGNEEDDDITWSEEDETYIFLFQQHLDDIPISNRAIRGTSSTYANVYYTKSGIRNISSYNFFDVIDHSEDQLLINPVLALEKVIDHYANIISKNENRLIFVDLNYISFDLENGSYELIPAWIFQIAESSDKFASENKENQSVDMYDYFIVDAITGEKIEWEIEGP